MSDVIIAGAGPVGLFLACELRLAKLDVLVLEQAEEPSSPLKRLPFGIRGLWGPSIEAFHRRGLLEQLLTHVAKGGPWRPAGEGDATPKSGPAGHFAGMQFDHANIDHGRWPYRLPSPADTQLGIEMEHLERVLTTRALELGIEIRRGRGVTALADSNDGVIVNDELHARWVVGCDGARSAVRKLANLDFDGTDPAFTGYAVQLDFADGSSLPMGRHTTPTGMYTQWDAGFFSIVDFDGGAAHAHAHRNKQTLAGVEAVLRRVSCTDVTLKSLRLASTWTDRSYQATTYRKGRVLLAGDSAHIHSPLGGQGLNLGLGDALNLGWKLAATVRGDAPAGLLDTYTAERHPIGARVLDWTRAQVALMQPNPHARALAAIVRDLIATRDGATYFAERVWGVSNRYDVGEEHPLTGRSCPDFELADGTRIGRLMQSGQGLLLDFDSALRPLNERIRYLPGDAKERLGLSAVLVRPDGVVAWASDGAPNTDQLKRAAARWF